jgi:lipopolysaccharide export system protein LptC
MNKRSIYKTISKKVLILLVLLSLNTFAYGETFVYNSHGRRDPFVPPYLKDKDTKRPTQDNKKPEIDYSLINLQAVVYDPQGDSAVIINGQIMKKGEKTDFFILKDIGEDSAVIEVLGEQKTLKLRNDDEQ